MSDRFGTAAFAARHLFAQLTETALCAKCNLSGVLLRGVRSIRRSDVLERGGRFARGGRSVIEGDGTRIDGDAAERDRVAVEAKMTFLRSRFVGCLFCLAWSLDAKGESRVLDVDGVEVLPAASKALAGLRLVHLANPSTGWTLPGAGVYRRRDEEAHAEEER